MLGSTLCLTVFAQFANFTGALAPATDQLFQLRIHRRARAIARHHPAADIIRKLGGFGEIAVAAVVRQEGRVKRIAGAGRVQRRAIASGVVLRVILG